MSSIISARGLTKRYGKTVAVDNIDIDIPRGRIVGLIGPNGAGKSSALKAILGLANYEGELSVLGKKPSTERAALMEEVCFIMDVAVLPRWIRVHQLIEITEKLHPGFSRERCMQYLAKTKVRLDHKVKQLSKGMVTLLHLAIVSATDAKLLVLDEPTLGLDIIHRKDFHTRLLSDYLDEDRTILITTHQVEEVEHILTDLIFIKDGRIALESTMDDVQERFYAVDVDSDKISEARQLGPIYESRIRGGQYQFMYDGVARDTLRNLGETHIPRVADLFVAIMNGGES